MSLGHGASIVRSGLVLSLDAANLKSYPGSGTTWVNLTGGGNNGTLTNSPTYSSSNKGTLVFNGTNQYAAILDAMGITDFTTASNYSVDFWVYLNSTQNDVSNTDNDIVEKWSGGVGTTGYPYTFRYIRASNLLQSSVYNGTTQQVTSVTISSNNWWHICGVFNWSSSLLTLYGNGGQVTSSIALTITGDITNTSDLYLMRRGGVSSSNYATGSLGSLKIYNRALTALEVRQNFEALRGRYGV